MRLLVFYLVKDFFFGKTVIVTEHDLDVIQNIDYIIAVIQKIIIFKRKL